MPRKNRQTVAKTEAESVSSVLSDLMPSIPESETEAFAVPEKPAQEVSEDGTQYLRRQVLSDMYGTGTPDSHDRTLFILKERANHG